MMKVINQMKKLFTDKESLIHIVLLEILGLLKIQNKISFQQDLYDKIEILLLSGTNQFQNFINLNVLVYNSEYFEKFITRKVLQKFLLELKFEGFNDYLVFFEFLYYLIKNCKEEKIKELQKKNSLKPSET